MIAIFGADIFIVCFEKEDHADKSFLFVLLGVLLYFVAEAICTNFIFGMRHQESSLWFLLLDAVFILCVFSDLLMFSCDDGSRSLNVPLWISDGHVRRVVFRASGLTKILARFLVLWRLDRSMVSGDWLGSQGASEWQRLSTRFRGAFDLVNFNGRVFATHFTSMTRVLGLELLVEEEKTLFALLSFRAQDCHAEDQLLGGCTSAMINVSAGPGAAEVRAKRRQVGRDARVSSTDLLPMHQAMTRKSLDWALHCFAPRERRGDGSMVNAESRIKSALRQEKGAVLLQACALLSVATQRAERLDHGVSDAALDTSSKEEAIDFSKARHFTMAEAVIHRLIDKIVAQTGAKLLHEQRKTSRKMSFEGIEQRVQATTLKIMVVTVLMVLLLLLLIDYLNPTDEHMLGEEGFGLFQDYVRSSISPSNESIGPTLSTDECQLLRNDSAVLSNLDSFRKMDPPAELVRLYDCTFYEASSERGNQRLFEMAVSSCGNVYSVEPWQLPTVVLFDVRHRVVCECLVSIGLNGFVIIATALLVIFVCSFAEDLAKITVIPLSRTARRMDQLARFDLHRHPEDITGNGEGRPIRELESMELALCKMQSVIESFAKYVPVDVVQQLSQGETGVATLQVNKVNATLLFCDIAGFTELCEWMGHGDLLQSLMSDYFKAMSTIISDTGGCLLEFTGDTILAVWNAPAPTDLHAVRAVVAAVDMQAKLKALQPVWDAKGYPRVRVRCGIHTSEVLAGNIGSSERMKYGVLGDGVNSAARLQEVNKLYGTGILMSGSTFQMVMASETGPLLFSARPVDRVMFKGKTQPTTLFEVRGFKASNSAATPAQRTAVDGEIKSLDDACESLCLGSQVEEFDEFLGLVHRRAWKEYVKKNFKDARSLFHIVNKIQKPTGQEDKPALLLAERCTQLINRPPPADWDGCCVLNQKCF